MEITDNSIVIYFHSLIHLAIIFVMFLVISYLVGSGLSWKSFSKKVGRLGKKEDIVFVPGLHYPSPKALIHPEIREKLTKDKEGYEDI